MIASRTPLELSLGAHGIVVLAITLALILPKLKKETIDFVVIEAPKVGQVSQLPQPIQPLKTSSRPRGVFGLSRKALTEKDSASKAESVKLGNTVAKAQDNSKLVDSDQDSLPIPADEYLISAMPELEGEVRIPYPREAREKRIQGAVLFDLLIDSNGVVREAVLLSGPGAGLNEAALEAVKKFRFKPARISDQSVAVRIRYAYRFVLE